MAKINVPKPPKGAFNPNRPASDLLKWQVEHLEWAIRHAGQRVGMKFKQVRTEADAAKRMAALIPQLESAPRLPYGTTPIPESTPPATAKKTRRRKTAKRATKPTLKQKMKPKTKRKMKRTVRRTKR